MDHVKKKKKKDQFGLWWFLHINWLGVDKIIWTPDNVMRANTPPLYFGASKKCQFLNRYSNFFSDKAMLLNCIKLACVRAVFTRCGWGNGWGTTLPPIRWKDERQKSPIHVIHACARIVVVGYWISSTAKTQKAIWSMGCAQTTKPECALGAHTHIHTLLSWRENRCNLRGIPSRQHNTGMRAQKKKKKASGL